MIPKLTSSTIYSTLGNNSSLIPLAIKDAANSCGLTTASYIAGDEVEGKDRFIDEFGTQAIWLFGLPTFNKAMDLTLFKSIKLDPKVDARILKNPEILKTAQDFAPTSAIKSSIENAAKHSNMFKKLTVAKFAASTILTTASYLGLTKFRHKYTENQIKKDYFEKQKNKNTSAANSYSSQVPFSAAFSDVHKNLNKNVNFTGGFENFIFDPVRNLMIVDGAITSERLGHARNPQDFLGYVIKEGSFWLFMYFAGPMISKAMEAHADKKGRSIDLDARVIFDDALKNSIKDGSLKAHIQAFKDADKSDVDIYKFAVQKGNNNFVINAAKNSDVIELVKGSDMVDTRRYIDLGKLRGINAKLEKLLNQYETSGETLDQFLKSVQKLKKFSILKNIGACIGALGVLCPALMLIMRKFSPEYQVKKDIEQKLARGE